MIWAFQNFFLNGDPAKADVNNSPLCGAAFKQSNKPNTCGFTSCICEFL